MYRVMGLTVAQRPHWKNPAAHCAHALASDDENVPAAHSVGALDPLAHMMPGGHGTRRAAPSVRAGRIGHRVWEPTEQ